LVDVKHVRHALGGTINDVLLAVITGALRSWLQARGHPVQQGDVLRAMLPMSIAVPASGSGHAGGNRVSATLVELPVGEADPAVRLQQISYQLAFLDESSHFVGAEAIVGIAGFGPPTLHALGARVGATVSSRLYNLVITNVPGPQRPLYAAGSRMVAAYPVVPLTQQQALSIGVISYDGGIYIGLYADRDALVDIDVLASCLEESLEELLDRCRSALRSLRIVPDEASAADDPRKNAG
jgi:WS/DGAT/MGAT family acyltransferase